MLSIKTIKKAQKRTVKMLAGAKIRLTDAEKERIEVCDFNLGRLENIGTEIVIYVNTVRCCAKELVLFPGQICPEHIHPQVGNYPGKEETFRCRWGEVFLYVPGRPTRCPKAKIPEDRKKYFTAWHEIILKPGEQYTLKEKTRHWFQAGSKGAIISEFSTRSLDKMDVFTDPDIKRVSNLG
ncbi:MAG: D-lyxose/D-mannose family sugar isomerase [Kiritimatiellae bacterium]|jgi:D-lyxose ketol-isomerase|nr:D-lyxose/D-mannose family sugar isomerase [Kiritimatiellia bacterium]